MTMYCGAVRQASLMYLIRRKNEPDASPSSPHLLIVLPPTLSNGIIVCVWFRKHDLKYEFDYSECLPFPACTATVRIFLLIHYVRAVSRSGGAVEGRVILPHSSHSDYLMNSI